MNVVMATRSLSAASKRVRLRMTAERAVHLLFRNFGLSGLRALKYLGNSASTGQLANFRRSFNTRNTDALLIPSFLAISSGFTPWPRSWTASLSPLAPRPVSNRIIGTPTASVPGEKGGLLI